MNMIEYDEYFRYNLPRDSRDNDQDQDLQRAQKNVVNWKRAKRTTGNINVEHLKELLEDTNPFSKERAEVVRTYLGPLLKQE